MDFFRQFSFLTNLVLLLAMAFAEISAFGFELQGFEVEAGTEVPLQVGARVKLQLPNSIHLRAGLGFVPEFYADTFGDLAGGVGIHGTNTATALSRALSGAIAIDVRAAYSLDPDGGFYAEGGYMFFTGGSGNITGEEAEDAMDLNISGLDSDDSVDIEGSFHALTVHVGYLLLLTERWSLNLDVGLVKPIMATYTVSSGSASRSAEEDLVDELEPYLEDRAISEMFIPTASAFVSYLF